MGHEEIVTLKSAWFCLQTLFLPASFNSIILPDCSAVRKFHQHLHALYFLYHFLKHTLRSHEKKKYTHTQTTHRMHRNRGICHILHITLLRYIIYILLCGLYVTCHVLYGYISYMAYNILHTRYLWICNICL